LVSTTPEDVISFWFGDKANDPEALSSGDYIKAMGKRWFMSSPEFDKEVQDKFADVIRAAAEGRVGEAWEGKKGRLARVILFDQLSRNAFRGTPEAFKYDDAAVELARSAVKEDLSATSISEVQFLLMPLMHSESLQDQDALVRKLDERGAVGGADVIAPIRDFADAHRVVIQRFGRFPHRNAKFGRETTAEETEWLNSPDCPGWAKSQ